MEIKTDVLEEAANYVYSQIKALYLSCSFNITGAELQDLCEGTGLTMFHQELGHGEFNHYVPSAFNKVPRGAVVFTRNSDKQTLTVKRLSKHQWVFRNETLLKTIDQNLSLDSVSTEVLLPLNRLLRMHGYNFSSVEFSTVAFPQIIGYMKAHSEKYVSKLETFKNSNPLPTTFEIMSDAMCNLEMA